MPIFTVRPVTIYRYKGTATCGECCLVQHARGAAGQRGVR